MLPFYRVLIALLITVFGLLASAPSSVTRRELQPNDPEDSKALALRAMVPMLSKVLGISEPNLNALIGASRRNFPQATHQYAATGSAKVIEKTLLGVLSEITAEGVRSVRYPAERWIEYAASPDSNEKFEYATRIYHLAFRFTLVDEKSVLKLIFLRAFLRFYLQHENLRDSFDLRLLGGILESANRESLILYSISFLRLSQQQDLSLPFIRATLADSETLAKKPLEALMIPAILRWQDLSFFDWVLSDVPCTLSTRGWKNRASLP